MNINLRKHVIDLIPMLTLGGIFKVLIIPNWDNMTFTNPITVNPTQTALLVLGWSLVMAILYYWKRLHQKQDLKKILEHIQFKIELLNKWINSGDFTLEAVTRLEARLSEIMEFSCYLDFEIIKNIFKKKCKCPCHTIKGAICGDCINSKTCETGLLK